MVHLIHVHVGVIMAHVDATGFGARHGALNHRTGLLNAMLCCEHGFEIGVGDQGSVVEMEGFCRHREVLDGVQRSRQFIG